jgi:hypothetical protein
MIIVNSDCISKISNPIFLKPFSKPLGQEWKSNSHTTTHHEVITHSNVVERNQTDWQMTGKIPQTPLHGRNDRQSPQNH